MKSVEAAFEDVRVIENPKYEDDRGYFTEIYNKKRHSGQGIEFPFIQDNLSFSKKKGTVRGIHFQSKPMEQTKFLTVISGSIYDIVVDLRPHSPTFKKWRAFELSAEKCTQLLIPRGYGHGFCTLTDNTTVHYKVDNHYSPEHNKGLRWDDPELSIRWPVKKPILSKQDELWPSFKDASCDFFWPQPKSYQADQ